MKALIKKAIGPIIQKIHRQWLKNPRRYVYKDIAVWVVPGVFPPFLTFSTKLLLEFVETLPIKGKTLLELGCGSGIISILAAKRGALVTATDINQVALDSLKQNTADNKVSIEILYSDLFGNLRGRHFDYIIINPPYYPKQPKDIAESAWFCGENFEYFDQLFSQLPEFLGKSNIYMILSDDCDIKKITGIAMKNAIYFELVSERKVAAEKNFIFTLTS